MGIISMADAVELIRAIDEFGKPGEVYNVGSGVNKS